MCQPCLHTARAVVMDKLADDKMCGDEECSTTLSMATATDDFIAPDCRFLNIKKGQTVYVYSKLVPEEGAGVFWFGSVSAHLLFSSSSSSSSSWDKQMCHPFSGETQNVTTDIWFNINRSFFK
ncbi:otoraplin-like isoform X3 [Solea solea]|uniref:otoraplin-like isoform X3 n=1 Tax=Solea solea TaxID=90069 RepID=UPI002729503C|nr:otoraplin-like isoform X3 [Solea solea]